MFCEKCGTPNNDSNTVCTNCGATLRHIPFDGYPQQGQPAQYRQQPYYPQQPGSGTIAAHRRPTVLYIIAGVLAAIQFFLVFLPHVAAYGRSYNFFGILSELFGLGRTAGYYYNYSNAVNTLGAVVVFLLFLFIVPMALQIVWAILSFMQKRPAGIFGVIASSVYLIASLIWLVVLAASLSSNAVTAVPFLMILFAIAGIPVSIVQLVKKKYL